MINCPLAVWSVFMPDICVLPSIKFEKFDPYLHQFWKYYNTVKILWKKTYINNSRHYSNLSWLLFAVFPYVLPVCMHTHCWSDFHCFEILHLLIVIPLVKKEHQLNTLLLMYFSELYHHPLTEIRTVILNLPSTPFL